MAIYKRFKIYYLGTNTSSSAPPSFSNGTYIQDFILKICEKPGLWTTYQSQLGSIASDGTITLNATGATYNSIVPFTDRTVFSLLPTTVTGYERLNKMVKSISAIHFDAFLTNYLVTNDTKYVWFAIANSTEYIPIAYRYSRTTDVHGYVYGWSASATNIRRKADDIVVGTGMMPWMWTANWSAASSHCTFRNDIVEKVGGEYYNFQYGANYPYGSGNSTVWFNAQGSSYKIGETGVNFLNDTANYYPPPYEEGGTSQPSEGGTGTFDDTSDAISVPTTPTTNFSNSGFVRIYNPALADLQALANYMWTDQTFLTTVLNHAKHLLENPIESVISLNMLPCAIPHGSPEYVKVLFINTGIAMPPATTQFVEVDCGTYDVKEYYGSALDYSPYTKIHCYLPYIGQVTLDTDEVMNKTLSIKYRIDIVTGMCVALISVNSVVMYQYSGHCAVSMPITSADFSNYISAAIQAAKVVGGVVAGAAGASGASAALMGVTPPRGSTTTTKFTTRNPNTGRQQTAGTIATYREASGASFGEFATKMVTNSVDTVMNSKLIVEHTGGFTGNSGYLAVRRPYLIFEIPRMCNPSDYGKYNGYPSMLTLSLGDCEGYTKVQEIQLTGFSATNPEMSEIAELLKAGVIF